MTTEEKFLQTKPYRFIGEALYVFVIFFLSYTSINKALNLGSFRMNLMKTGLFNEISVNIISIVVIVIELFVIISLFLRKQKGIFLFTTMVFCFTIYISYLQFNGLYEVCGCGGILNGLSYTYHLSINTFLIIAGLFTLWTLNVTTIEK